MNNKLLRFILWAAALAASVLIAGNNPIATTYVWAYFIPFLALSLYMIEKPVKAKGIFDEPKYLNGLKSLITLLMMLLAAGVKIPLLSQIVDLLGLITGHWDQIGQTVTFVLALYGAIRTIFASGDTAIIGPVAKAISPMELITPQKR